MGIFVRFFGSALFATLSSGLIAGGQGKCEEAPLPEWEKSRTNPILYYETPCGNTKVFTPYEVSRESNSHNTSPSSTPNLRASGSHEVYP